ncbi:Phosphatidylinositol glycan anchor biosynthesis class U protein [Pseudocercospora fuligena]|uniref:Phosphatidylinositol glycan anchor biosynthesis class U protein n=1 Tax=Pseudocercospora fuligena TaxID=685502 RepID=A0A8H6REL4_9PEZI|nr:Phosphatidylinositol glycan anchor biosynthesis class U protein [Pseudocercospora fuligena]
MDAIRQVYNDHPKTAVFTTAATLRTLLALTFPGLPDLLTGRVEISTPVNSFKRLQEGLFLYERGLDPYDGGIFHQAPLFLPLFSLLPSPATALGRIISVALYTALDILSAACLFEIAQSGAAAASLLYTSPRRTRAWRPASVAAVYLFNPYTFLACLGRPTTAFASFFTLLSIKHACQAKITTAAFALAIASYTSLSPILLLPPVGLLCYDQLCVQLAGNATKTDSGVSATPSAKTTKITHRPELLPSMLPFAAVFITTFAASTTFLLTLSRTLLPSWSFLESVYMTPLTLPDLTPNPGLWWYFFIEMFDAFREFFLGVFWLHMLSYSIPFCLRFRKQPLAAVILMMGINSVFQPYANAGDVGTWLSSLCLLGHVFDLCSTHRYTLPALAALLYASLLGPAFHHLWIYAGSGNANFFYAITLVWSLALLILLTDTLYAVLRDEWEMERPEGKGKEIRQV